VDARHEDFFERMPPAYLQSDENNLRSARLLRLITPLGLTRLAGASGQLEAFEAYLAPLPDEVEGAAWAKMIYAPQHWSTAVSERESIEESYRQVRLASLPQEMPLIVLTAENGVEAWRSVESPADESAGAIWLELQEKLSGLSHQSQWIIVKGSGHYIYFDRPTAIIEAVVSMMEH
jgi:pimeloyl-ACP methyl ester carboxylesterase